MRSNSIKPILVCAWLLLCALYLSAGTVSKAIGTGSQKPAASPGNNYRPQDYLGSDTCKACHEHQFTNFSRTIHAKLAGMPSWKGIPVGCEACHGPGKQHVENGGDKTKIRTFKNWTPEQITNVCLECHAREEERNNFRRGDHGRNNVACTSCHSPHGELEIPGLTAPAPSSQRYLSSVPPDRTVVTPEHLLLANEPLLCENCHSETKAQFSQPYHHRVPEGGMKCSDCHNPHGGFQLKQARLATGVDAVCVKCHVDKQGPFIFEHAPVKEEGCAICHLPHGSNNPRMLRRANVAQLCLECHSSVGTLAIGAPGTPNFHNLATVKFQNCTTCHVMIHGSNASIVFFR
jgi:predicted CXXCH cytochrome family protein